MSRYKIVETLAQLPASGVTAGTYTNATITVSATGIVSAASDGSPSVQTLNDLTDVNTSGQIDNQLLKYNGSEWVPQTVNLDFLSDVTITSPANGQSLVYNGSAWVNTNLNSIPASDIGVAVQAYNAQLTALGALSSNGYLVRTGASAYSARTISNGSGIAVTNGNGVAGNTTIAVTMTGLGFTSITGADDLLMFWNSDLNQLEATNIEDIVLDSTPITGVVNVGTGADIFKQISSKNLEFRAMASVSSGLTITQSTDQINFQLDSTLNSFAGLTPTANNFIVGNGASWVSTTPANSRTALGLGTIATHNTSEYVAITGGTMQGSLNMNSLYTLTNVVDPTNPQDVATKAYADSIASLIYDEGAGLKRLGNTVVVGQNADNSIIVNADDIQLSTTFTDNRYHTKAVLASTVNSSEGAKLIGTDTKTNLNNATNVETALEYLNSNISVFKNKFSLQGTGIWNLDVGAPNITMDTVNNVEVAQFIYGDDTAIYLDFMLPPSYDNTMALHLYITVAKSDTATGSFRMALAYQVFNTPGFSANDIIDTNPGLITTAQVLHWTIPAGIFTPLDTITLRLSRLGNSPSDTYAAGVNFLTSIVTQ